MEKNKPSVSELKQYLEDAGSYDGTLNSKEMFDLYKALEISKNTASLDDENRSKLKGTETGSSLLEDLRKNSVLVQEICESNRNMPDPFDDDLEVVLNINKAMESAKKFIPKKSDSSNTMFSDVLKETSSTKKCIDFNGIDICNPISTSHKPLKKLDISPIYKYPFYCQPEILALNYCERERLIGEFHSKLLDELSYCQKQSIYSAPWGKPIQANANFNGSLSKCPEKPTIDVTYNHEKIDIESDTENDEVFVSRAGRQTKRKLYTENRKDADLNKSPSVNAIRKRPNLSTLKNTEIIKRSKLFAESPSRSEKLFDNLLADEKKKLEAEQELETFKATLNASSDEENPTHDIAEIVHCEEPFQRRRIEPPSLKAGAKTKPSARGGKGATTRKANKKTNAPEAETQTYTPLKSTTSSINNKIKKGECPLCNEKFFQDELASHASTCCEVFDGAPIGVTTRKKAGQGKTITCETCDEVFPLSTEYEVHVRECIGRGNKI